LASEGQLKIGSKKITSFQMVWFDLFLPWIKS
jgi:hypothetical protein